jgi:hypothetical protein
MNFWAGFIVGVSVTLIALPIFSKQIMKFAAKRQLNNIIGSVAGMEDKFANIMQENIKEDVRNDGSRQESSKAAIN